MHEIKNISSNLIQGIIELVDVRKIFFVTIRRNAWHSTNIGRYQSGCMHSNLESAKKFAENLRKRGNSIYITEIPALIIQGDFITVVMTQINCEEIAVGYHSYYDEPEAIVDIGYPIVNQLHKLNTESFAWRVTPEEENLKCLITYKKIKDFEKYSGESVFTHQASFKNGNIYWNTFKNEKYKTSKYLQRMCNESIEYSDVDIDLAKSISMINFLSNLKPWSTRNLEYVKVNIDIEGCCEKADEYRYFTGLANIATLISKGYDLEIFSEEDQDKLIESTINTSILITEGVRCWELASITNIEILAECLDATGLFSKDLWKNKAEKTKQILISTINK